MIDYFKTTTIILSLVFLLSLLWGYARIHWVLWRLTESAYHKNQQSAASWPLPTLVVAPLVIAGAYALVSKSVIYPSFFEMESWQVWIYAICPAVVLILASGLASSIYSLAQMETLRWRAKPFFQFARAMGLPQEKILFRIVFANVMLQAWARSIPWIFGELIVVEAMFSAPGLGLDIWHYARTQETQPLLMALAWLLGLYVIVTVCQRLLDHRNSQKLSTYA